MLHEFSVVDLALRQRFENLRKNARVSARFRIGVKGGRHQRKSHRHRKDEAKTHPREFVFPLAFVHAEHDIGNERGKQKEKGKTGYREARVNHAGKTYRKEFEFVLPNKPYETADHYGDVNRNIEPDDIGVGNV